MPLLDFSRRIMQLVNQELIFGSGNRAQDQERTSGWNGIMTALRERPWEHFYQATNHKFTMTFDQDFQKLRKDLTMCLDDLPLVKQYGLEDYFQDPDSRSRIDMSFFKSTTQKMAESMILRTGNCHNLSHLFLYYFAEKYSGNKDEIELYDLSSHFLGHTLVKIVQGENVLYVDPWTQVVFPEAEFDANMRIILKKLQSEYELEVKKPFSYIPDKNEHYKERVATYLSNITTYLQEQDGTILPTDPKLEFAPAFCLSNSRPNSTLDSNLEQNTNNDNIPNIDLVPCTDFKKFINLVNFYRELKILSLDVFPVSPLREAIETLKPKTPFSYQAELFLTYYPTVSSKNKLPKPIGNELKAQIEGYTKAKAN